MKTFLLGCFIFLIALSSLFGQVETVTEWTFERDRAPWTGANCLKDVTLKDGILRAVASGGDPFFSASGLDIPTTTSQAVEIRYRTNSSGNGELFFTNTTEGPFGGFSPKKSVPWKSVGDEQWHTARIFPGWNAEKKIIKLRIDFPNLTTADIDKTFYEIDWIRVVDLNFKMAPAVVPDWTFSERKNNWNAVDGGKVDRTPGGWIVSDGVESDPMNLDVDEYGNWISLELSSSQAETVTLTFSNDAGVSGTLTFQVDEGSRWYNIDALNSAAWKGKVHLMRLDAGTPIRLRRMIVSDKPQGPAMVRVERIYQTEAINRTGKAVPLAVRLHNGGGETAQGLNIMPTELPPGIYVVQKVEPFDLPPTETKTVTLELQSEKPFNGAIKLTTPAGAVDVQVRIDENLNLPKADYVPKPQPVESDYEIGALYFPGWSTRERWDRIADTHPERKPVLGWYDEANPEVIDWQIKWSVENGIRHYYVDWYWHKGHQHLDHWVKSFYKARYKSMFKWAMMWANHNSADSHSEEDQRAVTQFWIENYFNTPEYLTKDGRPVVIIWSPGNMDRDVAKIEAGKGNTLKKGEGVKRLLDLSQKMAKDAGLKGIYFIAMKWPEASTRAEDIQWLADAGFEETSIYHFMHHGGKAKNPMRFDFQLVVDASLPYFEARHQTGILPFLPNLSTGWDSRPWHGDKQIIIENRTVERFRKICEDYKKFAEKAGIKQIALAPTNEWGEGSYIEPNAEYGFGMFETVRDVFGKKPQNGWPMNYGPSDVGLGPYDLPPVVKIHRTAWDFQDGVQGWTGFMGVSGFKAGNGKLSFATTSHDPALSTSVHRLQADQWSRLAVRMKISAKDGQVKNDSAQLFWSTVTSPVSEANSVRIPVTADGKFHDYSFDLGKAKSWRRKITSLRFDPVNSAEMQVEIESIRLE